MELLSQLGRLFEYDRWANGETLASLRAAVPCPPRSLVLLAHVVAAERLWHARLHQEPAPLAVWPELSLEECGWHIAELGSAWADYLDGIDAAALDRPVRYTNSKGERWSSTVGDVLFHVVLHSAYHRGQIAMEQRASGNLPAYTDFIHAVRRGLVE